MRRKKKIAPKKLSLQETKELYMENAKLVLLTFKATRDRESILMYIYELGLEGFSSRLIQAYMREQDNETYREIFPLYLYDETEDAWS